MLFLLLGQTVFQRATMVGGGGSMPPNPNGCVSDWLLIGCIRSADRIPPLPGCEDRVCGGTFSAEAGMLAKTVQCKYKVKFIPLRRPNLNLNSFA